MTKKTVSTILQLVIFLSLGAALMVWRYEAISPKNKAEMFAAFHHVQWWWAVPLLAVGFLSHYFRALRWKLLLQPVDVFPTTANTIFAVLTGYLTNALLPRMGEVVKCTILAKYEDVPVDKMVGTIIAERAFDLVCLLLLMLLTLLLQFEIIYPFARTLYLRMFTDGQGHFRWLAVGLFLALLLALIVFFARIARRRGDSRVSRFIRGIGEGLKAIGKIRRKGLFLLYTALVWLMYITMAAIGFWAMPELSHITPLAALSVISFGSVAMIATPGGIGVYPVIILQVLLLYGINAGLGFAYGWVSWSGQTAIVVVLGLASLILLPLYNRKKHEAQAPDNLG